MSKSKYDIEDDDNSYVLVGTPLAGLIPEDAKFTNKPKRPEEQIVTDEKGRQRFHGAFTGGFSAGYFNSVGTKEGWQPMTFKSSRGDRNNAGNQQRPEDFMDDEDFSEYGIAPKTLSIKTDFKDKSMSDKAASRKNNLLFFDDLIKPVRSTVGVRMLKKMGWREGQGIGPKIKRKLRKLKAKKVHDPGRKIYGVTLPTENEISDLEDEAISDDDDYLVSLYDVNEFRFEIKEDQFGLGYKRLDVNEIFSGSNKIGAIPADTNASVADLLFPGLASKNSKKSIKGQAFGVGDFEDEDDTDLYKTDNLENYDFDLDAKCEKEKRDKLNKSYGFGAFENDLMVMKKFHTSSKKQEPAKVFKAPEVPKGFDLMHKFEKSLTISSADATNDSTKQPADDAMNVYLKTATERGEVLGETFIKPDSVFDLISQQDKDKLLQAKLKQNLSIIASESIKIKQKTAEEKANEAKIAKQKRYEQYLNYLKRNYKDPYSFVDATEITEWEKEHEKEEFSKMFQSQTKKIDEYRASMNSKFQSKNVLIKTGDEIVENVIESEKVVESEVEKAAREKTYGKLTRIEYEWRPHNIVCKRFNVPNPYPDAKEYGTIGNQPTKRTSFRDEKFSIFDVLTQQNKFEKKINESIDATGNIVVAAVKASPVIVNKKDLSSNEMKIEFETKSSTGATTTASIDEEVEEVKKDEENEIFNKNNVYLQERPSIDIFKAIFDADDEEEEDKNNVETVKEMSEDEPDEDEDEEPMEIIMIKPTSTTTKQQTTPQSNSSIEIIPSSLSSIDYSKLNQYLRKEDLVAEKKVDNDFFNPKEYEQKTLKENESKANTVDTYGPPVAPILFKSKRDTYKIATEEVIQIDSSSSDSSSDIEFVEKKSADSGDSSSEKSSKKKKKKKKKSKKKSSKKHSKIK